MLFKFISYNHLWFHPLRATGALLICAVLILGAAGCPDLPDTFVLVLDGGGAGFADAARADRRLADAGSGEGGSVDAGCGPQTPLYGEPCEECGQYVCDLSGSLICYDPGLNDCGVCGELDESAGRLGEFCGTCGQVECEVEGLATICVGEHPINACGGCAIINPEDAGSEDAHFKGPPGETCSSCATGEWRCAADQNDLICYRGRGLTGCGGCDRCVLYHAAMDQRQGGEFVKMGTLALVEDTGTDVDVGSDQSLSTQLSLVFDPLFAGPAASALGISYVILSPSEDPNDPSALLLFPEFAASQSRVLSDELRRYALYPWIDLSLYQYVIIYDYFFEQVISAGRLLPGPPDMALDAGIEDGGATDASGADRDATGNGADATLGDRVVEDVGVEDAGRDAGAGQDVRSEDAVSVERRVADASAVG